MKFRLPLLLSTLVKDRSKDGGKLALNEAELWADYVGFCSGLKIASDNLTILRDERKELVRFAATLPACSRFVPLDFWQHARTRSDALHVFLSGAGDAVYLLLLNWDDAARTYAVCGLPTGSAVIRGAPEVVRNEVGTRITLAARHAAVFHLPDGFGFNHARKTVRVE